MINGTKGLRPAARAALLEMARKDYLIRRPEGWATQRRFFYDRDVKSLIDEGYAEVISFTPRVQRLVLTLSDAELAKQERAAALNRQIEFHAAKEQARL